jgi:DNA-directed RNA polymerase specialized sigma24 family protein
VPAAEDWIRVVLLIRADADPLRSPHLGKLYDLALADGPRLLKSFQKRLGDDRILDLVHDLLATKLEAIVAADEPRALFCTALQRRAISWLRRGDAAVVEDAPERPPEGVVEDERQGFLVDAKNALEGLPERERAMVVAVALGEEREAIAQAFRTTRANVDQIVSRVRRRFAVSNEDGGGSKDR